MNSNTKAEVIALARAQPEREVCGFIAHSPKRDTAEVIPCTNESPDTANSFVISQRDYIRALNHGLILGVYHSHPTVQGFTREDLQCAEAMAVPFYVYCLKQDSWHDYLPRTYQPPLLGSPFIPGFRDCYELVRLYYRQHRGCVIGDYTRNENDNLRDLILANFAGEGFEQISVPEAKIGDTLMFRSEWVLNNHFGILTGPSRMWHHPLGNLSREEMVTNRWLERAVCAFRLKPR